MEGGGGEEDDIAKCSLRPRSSVLPRIIECSEEDVKSFLASQQQNVNHSSRPLQSRASAQNLVTVVAVDDSRGVESCGQILGVHFVLDEYRVDLYSPLVV